MAKTLLIGWDAADWEVINPLLEQGLMPTLKRLISQGVHGNIATLQPALSPMLWTSIATGKRAYDHGIHGFVQVNPTTAKIESVRVSQRRCKAVWNILNEAGLTTNVVNWWPSHPAEVVNGVYVSNRFHQGAPPIGDPWPLSSGVVSPLSWEAKLADLRLHPAELTLAHIIPFIADAHLLDPEKDAVLKPLMRILAHACSIHNAATELMAKTEWDFMAVYQEAIDHFGHLAMKYHPPQLQGISDADFARYHNIITAAYRFHDMMLQRLLELAGPDTNVLLLSDHGFQSGAQRVAELPDVPAAPALEHRQFGVLVAQGPDVEKGKKIYGASLLDIAPTVLHLHGLPVGEDMEGKVLTSLLRNQHPAGYIESWEHTGVQPLLLERDADGTAEQEVLQQLAEIGYVELPEKEKQAYVKRELHYNLIQSLVDGEKWDQALTEAERFFTRHRDPRGAKLLLHIADQQHKTALFEETLKALTELIGVGHPDVLYFKGLQKLKAQAYKEALEYFLRLEGGGALSTQLYGRIAQGFYLAQKFETALSYVNKALDLEREHPQLLSLQAGCYMALNQTEKALEAYLSSIELQYFQPLAHYNIAKLWLQLNREEEAVKALQLCVQQAPKHAAAHALLSSIQAGGGGTEHDPIIVVSGLPRSGTSMLMRLLHKGGIPVLTDSNRAEDAHNPLGYFEFDLVKQLPQDNSWVGQACGKAIKVVSPLLRYLPDQYPYYMLHIKRPMLEILVSQEKMKGRKVEEVLKNFPFKMALDFEAEEKRTRTWLNAQPNVKVLELDYQECIADPARTVEQIAAFLPLPLDQAEAKLGINTSLYRNKLA
jgi:predicted AlkP superfamily phosphohydrolase/phosphomutase/tetratricopeptide (TPR) repeat protein